MIGIHRNNPLLVCFVPLVIGLLAPEVSAKDVRVIGSLTREAELSPGEEHRGAIVLANNSDEAVDFELTPIDLVRTLEEGKKKKEPETLERSNAGWITWQDDLVRVEPGDRVSTNYTISVPDREDLHGSYWSAVRVAPQTVVRVDKKEQEVGVEGKSLGLRINTRLVYTVRLFTHIENDRSTRGIDIVERQLRVNDGQVHLAVAPRNTGTRIMRPDAWLELFDSDGRSLGKYPASASTLYPGRAQWYPFDLTGVPSGDYSATVVLDTGGEDVFGARYHFTIPDHEDAKSGEEEPADPAENETEDNESGRQTQ